MFDFIPDIIAIAKEEALLNANPKERCGAIVASEFGPKLIECTNVADDPVQQFKISAQEWAFLNVDHDVLAVWHTHPGKSAAPTQADRVGIEKTGLPWHIVSWPEGGHSYTLPTGYEAPYTGRVFNHGIMDCYALCRDWYKREFAVDLPDDERVDDWWNKGQNLYLDGFEKNGFVSMDLNPGYLKRGDGILMKIASKVPNHAGVYTGDGRILHHRHGRLSSSDIYGGALLKCTTHQLRHKSQL